MKLHADLEISVFEKFARNNNSLNWYAIADSAQNASLPRAMITSGRRVACLFGSTQESLVSEHAPHLVELDSPLENYETWRWILLNARSRPCLTIIAAEVKFDVLLSHLMKCTEVVLPDEEMMFFAYWDPVILGTLIGQPDDLTLHVKGPVLTPEQINSFMRHIEHWWYWDRTGVLHLVAAGEVETRLPSLPVSLTQEQVDELIEASIPHHILYYIELNQPLLMEEISLSQRHEFVRKALQKARGIGLVLMGDLVNFVCLQLIYAERMQNDVLIDGLLNDVKNQKITFAEALKRFP